MEFIYNAIGTISTVWSLIILLAGFGQQFGWKGYKLEVGNFLTFIVFILLPLVMSFYYITH